MVSPRSRRNTEAPILPPPGIVFNSSRQVHLLSLKSIPSYISFHIGGLVTVCLFYFSLIYLI